MLGWGTSQQGNNDLHDHMKSYRSTNQTMASCYYYTHLLLLSPPLSNLSSSREAHAPRSKETGRFHLFFSSLSVDGKIASPGLGRREEAVEVERQAVELLVPAVPLERPEPHPPRQAPVVAGVLGLQRVVQEHGHDQPHRRRRREDGVDVVVELRLQVIQKRRVSKTIFSILTLF